MGWIDVVVLLALAIFVYAGMQEGFISGIYRLAGLLISLAVPFLLYVPVSRLFVPLGLRTPCAEPVAFILLFLLTWIVYFVIVGGALRPVPRHIWDSGINRVLGIFPWLLNGLIVVAVILALLVVTHAGPFTQSNIDKTVLARGLVWAVTPVVEKGVSIFGQLMADNCGFLTVKPTGDERIMLGYKVSDPTPDPTAEDQMLKMVNQERSRRGLRTLVMDEGLRRVARAHSADMFRRGYFSHNSLNGTDPFTRMRKGGVRYIAAGENIALSPTVKMAEDGFMKSPGHRENILRPVFRRVGIGAMRGGIHGIMFTQDFAN